MKRAAIATSALTLALFFIFTKPVAAEGQGPMGTESHGLDPAVLIGVAIMLLVAKFGGELFERLQQPAVLGELIGGIVLGNLVIFGFYRVEALKTNETIAALAELGVIIGNDERREALLKLLGELFATGSRDKWVAILRAADIVSAPINTLLEASNDPDVLANGYITEVEYPKHGKKLKVHGSPWQFSETPAKIGVAPELGEHNDAILQEVGYSTADIQGFRDRNVI